MSLDALLAKLEAQPVTPVTDGRSDSVTPQPQQTQPCTAVTPVTAEIDTSDWQERYEAQAATLEYDGELPRHEAEYRAKREIFYAFAEAHYPQVLATFETIINQPLRQ